MNTMRKTALLVGAMMVLLAGTATVGAQIPPPPLPMDMGNVTQVQITNTPLDVEVTGIPDIVVWKIHAATMTCPDNSTKQVYFERSVRTHTDTTHEWHETGIDSIQGNLIEHRTIQKRYSIMETLVSGDGMFSGLVIFHDRNSSNAACVVYGPDSDGNIEAIGEEEHMFLADMTGHCDGSRIDFISRSANGFNITASGDDFHAFCRG